MFLRPGHTQLKKYRRLAIIATGLVFAGSTAVAESPRGKPDDAWVSVSGTVISVEADSFLLDYGKGLITVEMDDGDRDADGYKLLADDKVRVEGRIDDDLYEKRTLEASSVYVEKLNTTFYASAVDEEEYLAAPYLTITGPVVVSETVVEGIVTRIADDDEFILDTGLTDLRVETDAMPYDPLDNMGYQQLDIGDRVSVMGRMDDDFLEGREFVAESIVTLAE